MTTFDAIQDDLLVKNDTLKQGKSRLTGFRKPPYSPKTQWQPGQSGNPAGRRPNTASITYWYKRLLEDKEGLNAKDIALTAIKRAKAGSLPHAIEVTDRTDGPVPKETHIKSLVINVGEDYAREALEEARQERLQIAQEMLESDDG